MQLTKTVPLSLALGRVAPLLTKDLDRQAHPFLDFHRERLSMRGGLPMPEALAVLDEIPPGDSLGEAYAGGLRQAIAATDADTWRAFDHVHFDAETAAIAELHRLVDGLEERSPLLVPLADALLEHVPDSRMPLGQVADLRARVTEAAIASGQMYDHDDHVRPPQGWIAWEDVEHLIPGTSARILQLLDELYAGVPVGDDDASARREPLRESAD